MNLIIFIIKMMVISALLFCYYLFFLKNKIFHQYNRFYLLSIPLIAMMLPLMNIPVPGFLSANQGNGIKLLQVITTSEWEEAVVITPQNHNWLYTITWQHAGWFVFTTIALIQLIRFASNILQIKRIAAKYPHSQIQGVTLFQTAEPGTPFSFFSNIFWNNQIDVQSEKGKQIFRHEWFHVQQKHTADIIYMDLITIFCWFNPVFYLAKKELRTVHEFLADQFAVAETNRYGYVELLIQSASERMHHSLTHPFFNNQIKRRITMLIPSKKNRYGYISRLMALPLLFVLACAFAVNLHSSVKKFNLRADKPITVTIDAGHGGIDPGTQAENGILEKNISLEIAKKIKELSGQYNIHIVMTRATDELPGNAGNIRDGLSNRLKIASASKSDLFISLHMDANVAGQQEKSGFALFVPQNDGNNHTQSKILASALTAELKNTCTVDELLKQHTQKVLILDQNSMPAVLVECGYINNKKDLEFISNGENQEKIAKNILEGILRYSYSRQTLAFTRPLTAGDTITPAEAEKIDINSISSMNVFKEKNIAIIKLKNGDSVIMKTHSGIPEKGKENEKIFTSVEVESQYPGGQSAWMEYLMKNFRYPDYAARHEIQGTVISQFIVDNKGNISNIKILQSPDTTLSNETLRIIQNSGKWTPAVQNGKKVKSYKTQPVVFKLERQ